MSYTQYDVDIFFAKTAQIVPLKSEYKIIHNMTSDMWTRSSDRFVRIAI